MIDREHWVLKYLPRTWMMRWVTENRTVAITDSDFFTSGQAASAATTTPPPPNQYEQYDSPVGAVPLSDGGPPSDSSQGRDSTTDVLAETGDAIALDEYGSPSAAADLVSVTATPATDGSLRLVARAADDDPATPLRVSFGMDVDATLGPEFVAQIHRSGQEVTGSVIRVDDGRVVCAIRNASAQGATIDVTIPPRCLGQLDRLRITASTVRTGGAPGSTSTTVDAAAPTEATTPGAAMTEALVRPVRFGGKEIVWASGTEGPVLRWVLIDGRWVRDPTGLGGVVRGLGAVRAADGSRVVVARGTNNKVYVRTAGPTGSYGPWRTWPGLITSAPAVVQASDGAIEAYVRDLNGNLGRLRSTASGVVWQRLTAGALGAPAAVRFGKLVLVAYTGTDQLVRAAWCTTTGCGAWHVATGRPTREGPTLVAQGGKYYAGVRGTEGRAWTVPVTISGPGWGTWATIPDRSTGPLVLLSGTEPSALVVDAAGQVISASGRHDGPWSDWSTFLVPN